VLLGAGALAALSLTSVFVHAGYILAGMLAAGLAGGPVLVSRYAPWFRTRFRRRRLQAA